jgi:transforming growth factor-beta-induced protein
MGFLHLVFAVSALSGIADAGSHITGTIVETAAANGSFNTLAAALGVTNLVDTLNGAGPFTVFAPTDAAFGAMLAELGITPEQALQREDLPAILTYHVVPGKVMSSDLSNGMVVTTVQGAMAQVSITGSTVAINDAKVTQADIECSNGVIHVIDKVLMPPTIVQIAVSTPGFSTLVAALTKANLVDTLSGAGPFTVFAPTDDAFTKLLSDLGATAEQLLAREDLADILKYHVASGKVMSTDLSDGMSIDTLQGSKATISINGQTVKVGDATVTMPNVVGANGVVHVIDKVLLPPAETNKDGAAAADGAVRTHSLIASILASFLIVLPNFC